jgi:1-acyl-sn-glycerol-3-phosphate acyltransferase
MSLQHAVQELALAALTPADRERLDGIRYDRGEHGYDPFGLNPGWMAIALAGGRPLYRKWFRVSSRDIANIPMHAPAILAANHGGELPFDGLMLWHDVVTNSRPPRVPRFVLDHFVPRLPFVGTFFARCGAVAGSRRDVHELLERGELVALFPEGMQAIGKPRAQHYRIQPLHPGCAEMSIRHRAPIVPVAIVGPDDQYPLTVHAPVHALGIPYLPLSPVPIPLPVRYTIAYGEPIRLHDRYATEAADRPDALGEATAEVRAAMQRLLDETRKAAAV